MPARGSGMNLHRVPMEQVSRGMLLAAPGLLNPSFLFNVDLKLLKTSKAPMRDRQRVKLHLGTSVTNTLVVLMEKQILEPGEKGLAQLRLMKPVAALPRDPFVICPLNVHMVMGGGNSARDPPGEVPGIVKAQRTLPYLSALKSRHSSDCVQHFFEAHPISFFCPQNWPGLPGSASMK